MRKNNLFYKSMASEASTGKTACKGKVYPECEETDFVDKYNFNRLSLNAKCTVAKPRCIYSFNINYLFFQFGDKIGIDRLQEFFCILVVFTMFYFITVNTYR